MLSSPVTMACIRRSIYALSKAFTCTFVELLPLFTFDYGHRNTSKNVLLSGPYDDRQWQNKGNF